MKNLMNLNENINQLIKPAKCCYNCVFFNNSINSLKGICNANEDNYIEVYPFEYCKLFKMIKNKFIN